LTAWYGDADGRVTKWQIVEIRHLAIADWNHWSRWAVLDAQAQLTITLITCDGAPSLTNGVVDSPYRIVVHLQMVP
jgi:hypothetical protein